MSTPVFPRMHVSLYVRDLTATVNFYTSFFGRPATKIRRGYAKYVLDEPALIISFVENAERVASNFGHLGFQVATVAEMEARLAAAQRSGLVAREELNTNCCYARQDKFWVTDPDGVQWEVYYFHEDAEFNDPRYQQEYDQAAADSACCMAPAAETATATTATAAATADWSLPVAAPACAPGGNCC